MSGDELDLVNQYFGDADSSDDGDDDAYGDLYDEPEAPAARDAEMDLVTEYRETGFDNDEVAEQRQIVDDVASGAYTADDYLNTYEDDGEPTDDSYAGLGEPAAGLSPDEALERLMQLPPDQMAAGLQYLEANHPGMGEPLLQAYVDRQESERMTNSWAHLTHLNEVWADMQDRQAAQTDQEFAAAESHARDLVADASRRLGNVNGDVDVTLKVADALLQGQIGEWHAEGYTPEEIATVYGPELAQWAIEQAAEKVKHAHVHANALKRV